MEVDCLKIKSKWLRSTLGGILKRVISKKLGINLTAFCLNDLDIESIANDDYMEVHLDINTIISKKDIMTLIGGNK